MSFSSICTPAQLYLVLSVIALIFGLMSKFSISTLFIKGFFILLWTWILNWLCSKGYKTISWILVLLPFIFMALTVFMLADIMANSKKH